MTIVLVLLLVLVLGFVFSLPTIPSIQLPLKWTIHFAQPTLFFEDENENDPSLDHQPLNVEVSCERRSSPRTSFIGKETSLMAGLRRGIVLDLVAWLHQAG